MKRTKKGEKDEGDEEPPPPARKKKKYKRRKKVWDTDKVPDNASPAEDPRHQVKQEQEEQEEEEEWGSGDDEEDEGSAKGKRYAGRTDMNLPYFQSNDFECSELLCCQYTRF